MDFTNFNLDTRETYILDHRMAGITLDELGQHFGITRERIRQIERNVLRRIEDYDPTAVNTVKASIWTSDHPRNQEREADKQRKLERRQLMAAFKIGYDRHEIVSICHLDKYYLECPDEELCLHIRKVYNLTRFHDFIYCQLCHIPKANGEYSPGVVRNHASMRVCKPCGAKRHKALYHSDPKRFLDYAKTRRNRNKVYQVRNMWKKIGLPDMMPPLPKKKGEMSEAYAKRLKYPRTAGWTPGDGLRQFYATATPEQLAEIEAKRSATREAKSNKIRSIGA